jgi:enoyl-CoA hydratase/carnithine racemase
MVSAMLAQLRVWADDPAIAAVLIDAVPGRAFCAGGDIRALYESGKKDGEEARAFFATEYRLNAAIHALPKPYIAVIDGVAMGGGAGVSVHGRFRVVSERAVFAMPETAIGLFPDIGASYFLPRLPGAIGMYLALTGVRIGPTDMVYTGIATHFVKLERQAEIAPRLAAGEPAQSLLASLSIEAAPAPLAECRAAVDRTFSQPSVEAILEALGQEGQWGEELRRLLLTRSPTSLKVSFRQMGAGAGRTLESCLAMEYRVACRMLESHDFYEGVRAAVIDKDQAPRWDPPQLPLVSDADIAHFFSQLEHEFTF